MLAFFEQLFLTALIALPIYLLLRALYRKLRPAEPVNWVRECFLALFIGFMAGLVALVLQPGHALDRELPVFAAVSQRVVMGHGINLVPFATIRAYFSIGFSSTFVVNIIANVLMFVPCGFCLPLLWRRWQRWRRILPVSLALPLCIELAQLFIGRSVDVDDWMLNALGILFGYGVYALLKKRFPALQSLSQAVQKP